MNKNQGEYPSVSLVQGFSTNLEQEIEDARLVKPPFPPQITSKDLIVHKKNGDVPSRSPNAFMIYRKLFVDELHNKGLYLPMTTASSMTASSWKNEPEFVKQEYRRIASEAKSRHLRLYSNQIPRKRNQRKIRIQSQITSQYDQSNSENSTAGSSPIIPETSILTEEFSCVPHIPNGLTSRHINNDEPAGFYLPQIHQFPVEFDTRNNNISVGNPSMELVNRNSGFEPFQDHANMVLYVPDYHRFGPYQSVYEFQGSNPQTLLPMPSYYY